MNKTSPYALALLALAPLPAGADGLGGLSALGAVYALSFIIAGIGCALLLLIAFLLKQKNNRRTPLGIAMTVPAGLSAPFMFFIYIGGLAMTEFKYPLVMSLILAAATAFYFVECRHRRLAITIVLTLIALTFIIIPADFFIL